MDEKKLEVFREGLLEMRKILTNEYEKTVESSSEEFEDGAPDMNDEASRTISRRIILELGDKSHETLQNIDNALERIEDGVYGVCDECEDEIPEKRLELVPYAQYCVNCKELREKAEREAG